MTGLECLQDELVKCGFSRQQAKSKTVVATLNILAGSNGKFLEIDRLLEEESSLKIRVEDLKRQVVQIQQTRDSLVASLKREEESFNNDVQAYVQRFYEALWNCETKEGRDVLRMAQLFMNTVSIDTVYDNTAFINGLASILTRGNACNIDQLKPISKQRTPYVSVSDGGFGYKITHEGHPKKERL